MRIAREIGDRRDEANALFNSALALDQLGERAQAAKSMETALRTYEQIAANHLAERARAQITEWQSEDSDGELLGSARTATGRE